MVPAIRKLQEAEGKCMIRTQVRISGMMCGMCESHLNSAVREAFPVQKVHSSHKTGMMEIISGEALDISELKKVIEATGYQVMDISMDQQEKTKGFLHILHRN